MPRLPDQVSDRRLLESARRLNTAQRLARLGDFEWDLESDRLTWSDSLFELVQYDPAAGIDTDTFNRRIIHPEDRARVARTLREAVESEQERATLDEYRLQRKDGRWIHVRTEALVERSPEGGARILGTVQDVTAQRLAKRALEESEERFRMAFNQQFQFMAILSPDGRVLEVNELPLEIQGATRDDYVGKLFWQAPAWRDLPDWQAIIESRIATARTADGPVLVEDVFQDAVGESRWADAAYTAIRDDEGELRWILVQATDITERKRIEERLRRREQQLSALSAHVQSVREEQSERIARELHDELGQALTALRFDLSWLVDHLREHDAEPGLIQRAESMTSFIDQTIHGVRRIATELRPRILDDAGLVAALEWQASEFEQRTGIRCAFTPEGDRLEPDSERSTAIFRCFQELLTNVARHSGAHRVTAALRRHRDSFELIVSDDGVGLSEEARSRPGPLGLVGIRERALGFGGELFLAGRPDRGTTARVSIPAADAGEPAP